MILVSHAKEVVKRTDNKPFEETTLPPRPLLTENTGENENNGVVESVKKYVDIAAKVAGIVNGAINAARIAGYVAGTVL